MKDQLIIKYQFYIAIIKIVIFVLPPTLSFCLSEASHIAPLFLILKQYPFHSSILQRGEKSWTSASAQIKTVCQAALTLHPYRLFDLRHFISGSCQPPSESNNKKRHALCTTASLFMRHHYLLTACTLV